MLPETPSSSTMVVPTMSVISPEPVTIRIGSGVHAARIRDHRSGRGDRDVVSGIGVEERIAAEVHRKGTVWVAPEHLLKMDLVGNPRFVVPACPVGKGHCAAVLLSIAIAGISVGSEIEQTTVSNRLRYTI